MLCLFLTSFVCADAVSVGASVIPTWVFSVASSFTAVLPLSLRTVLFRLSAFGTTRTLLELQDAEVESALVTRGAGGSQ
jgi:hypothetical protein